jgi:hypothetical protein
MSTASMVLRDAGDAVANVLFCLERTPFLILTHAYAPPNVLMSYLQALDLSSG